MPLAQEKIKQNSVSEVEFSVTAFILPPTYRQALVREPLWVRDICTILSRATSGTDMANAMLWNNRKLASKILSKTKKNLP